MQRVIDRGQLRNRRVGPAARRARTLGALLVAAGMLAGGCAPTDRTLFEALAGPGDTDGASGGDTGGSGGMPAGAGGRDAGTGDPTYPPEPGLDSDVRFEWTQTSGGGGCSRGRFVGTFECRTAGAPVLTGVIRLALENGASETLHAVRDGQLDVVDPLLSAAGAQLVLLSAGVSGELDCARDAFAGETIAPELAPQTVVAPLPFGFLVPISARLEGTLIRTSQVLGGTIRIQGGLSQCSGSWQARRVP